MYALGPAAMHKQLVVCEIKERVKDMFDAFSMLSLTMQIQ